MAMIFPGMDPYLEEPLIWTGLHTAMVVYIRDQLQPVLRPRYVAAVEERVYIQGPDRDIVPDVWLRRTEDSGQAVALAEVDAPVVVQVPQREVHEAYVNILDLRSGQRVVSVIEVVSPANKFAGPGRTSYETKQRQVLESHSHLVEIDLLRRGPHVLAIPEWVVRNRGDYDYLICVNRAQPMRDKFAYYPCLLQQRLPRIAVPLAGDDPDVRLDLQAVLNQAYEAGRYRDRINYDAPCVPPLSDADQAWANERIRQAEPT